MKYVPVLRYRDSEKKVIESVALSNKILPLIEVVQEKRRNNMKTTCFEEIKQFLRQSNTPVMIDFPLYIKIKSNTLPGVRNFITPLLANPVLRLDHFKKFIGHNIIPVVSYNPNTPFFTGSVSREINELRKSFKHLALRVFISNAKDALAEADGLLNPDDVIILDIDEAPHNSPAYKNFYPFIHALVTKHKCKSVLLRTVIGPDITYTGLKNNSVIPDLDNSHRDDHIKYNFHAFGDYCGIKKDLLTKGGIASPGCIFYHWWNNSYYGHKGLLKQPQTFTSMVVKSLINSSEWNDYAIKSKKNHRSNCPGCYEIAKGNSGNAAPKWKTLMASHYLYTMEEFL